jgi:type II secretory pathway component GspD/PulD (secretin)
MLAVLLLAGATGVFIANPGLCGTAVAEEIISMDLADQPLGQVLDDIAAATGYRFIFDESWENFPISASISNESLHKGLKRILRNLNNVIIYRSDRTIQIIIFDEAAASENRSNALVKRASDEEPARQPYTMPAGLLPAPPPPNEELPDVEDDDPQPEPGDSSATEADEAAPGEEETTPSETGESAAEADGTEASEPEEDTPTPDEQGNDRSATDNQKGS